jgi:hypothetical protein
MLSTLLLLLLLLVLLTVLLLQLLLPHSYLLSRFIRREEAAFLQSSRITATASMQATGFCDCSTEACSVDGHYLRYLLGRYQRREQKQQQRLVEQQQQQQQQQEQQAAAQLEAAEVRKLHGCSRCHAKLGVPTAPACSSSSSKSCYPFKP